ncbi:hypothetical protein Tco_1143126 [Tanacetum coccineum]
MGSSLPSDRNTKLDASKQGRRINAIDADEDITLVNVQDDVDNEMFDVNALNGEEVFVAWKNENVVEKVVDAAQDKGKGIMVEEPVKTIKKKDLIRLDDEIAKRLQAEFDEEERLPREKDEANVSLIEEWDDIQAKIKADHKLAQRLAFKRKVDEDKDTAELQSLMEVIPDEEEVAINVVPLATKPLTIVDWKIHKEGKKNYYQIVRVDGKSQMYRVFSLMLKSFSRNDLEDLYKLVKAKYKSTRLVADMDLLLLGDLKTMFEPHVEDEIWKLQQRYKVLSWKLFDSCRVHCLSLQYGMIYMLVEKRYPLTPPIITDMLNKKLQYKVNAAEGVNAASEEVSTAELVSTAYLKEFDLLKWYQQVVSELVALRNFARRYGSRFCTHGGCIQSEKDRLQES